MNPTFEQLYRLAKDRPLITNEIHTSNDFYGNATILKDYAGFPKDYQIKAAIEHGPFGAGFVWDVDINSPVPAIFSFASYRFPVLKKRTNKALFPIGPIMHYAPYSFSEDSIAHEKKRLGKNLLVFPPHSTHWIDINYDIHDYCEFLEYFGKEFNQIRICLYWKDILRGFAEEYSRHGFECVTAGHIYDPLFLPRLKTIIELSSLTTSSANGTHILYCIMMEKPHFLMKIDVRRTAEKNEIIKRDTPNLNNSDNRKAVAEIWKTFSILNDDVTPRQKEIARKYWGMGENKSINEMRMLFEITEDIYQKGGSFSNCSKNILLEQSVDYLNEGKNEKALHVMNQALEVDPELKGIAYGKAIALARLGDLNASINVLEDLLSVVPDHKRANNLLKILKMEPEKPRSAKYNFLDSRQQAANR